VQVAEEELGVFRQQVEVAERMLQLEESAGITAALVRDGSIPTEWRGRRAYRYRLKNIGRAHASDVDASLIDQEEHEVSEMSFDHSRNRRVISGAV